MAFSQELAGRPRESGLNAMRRGDKFTIAGIGRGSKGQLVIDGVNPKTKRKCKAVKPAILTVGEEVSSG